MKFRYFYGSSADQYSFIRIPKLLITDNQFSELTIQAKMLYGLLLDRMAMSIKNKWGKALCEGIQHRRALPHQR